MSVNHFWTAFAFEPFMNALLIGLSVASVWLIAGTGSRDRLRHDGRHQHGARRIRDARRLQRLRPRNGCRCALPAVRARCLRHRRPDRRGHRARARPPSLQTSAGYAACDMGVVARAHPGGPPHPGAGTEESSKPRVAERVASRVGVRTVVVPGVHLRRNDRRIRPHLVAAASDPSGLAAVCVR